MNAIAEALLARIAEPALARQPFRLDVGFKLMGRGRGASEGGEAGTGEGE